jgi:hypothetical protein
MMKYAVTMIAQPDAGIAIDLSRSASPGHD